jgi:hypothetical protein
MAFFSPMSCYGLLNIRSLLTHHAILWPSMQRVEDEAASLRVKEEAHLYFQQSVQAQVQFSTLKAEVLLLAHHFLLKAIVFFLLFQAEAEIFLETKPICQVCKRRGHEALNCWYQFDNSTYPSQPQTFLNTTISTPHEG